MRTDIETRLRNDAATDTAFRAALLADPASAVAERYGVAIPDGITLRIVEEAADEVTLVLPEQDAAMLSDDQLARFATGGGYDPPDGP